MDSKGSSSSRFLFSETKARSIITELSSNSLFQLSSMHRRLLHILKPTPLCLYSSMSVGRHRTCSCSSVPPPYTSMLGGARPSTAALLINRISNNVADAPQSKLVSSTRLPFTPTHLKSLGFKPSPPHLALLSLFFLLSVAAGAMLSLAVICLPTIADIGLCAMIRTMMQALRRLGASVHKLSQVVSEEVPGTLSFLQLSAREINELTQQLTNLRQKISATDQYADWKQSQKQQIL